MAKYKVEVGGFVTVYRQRVITVYAESDEEAKEKAIGKFIDIQQRAHGSPMCDEGTVNSISAYVQNLYPRGTCHSFGES